jgi:hypothetical protein
MEYFLGLQLKWDNDTEKLQENLELGLGMTEFRFLNGGHYRAIQLGDRRNDGESKCKCGDGTGQMAQQWMFMMMMMMMMMIQSDEVVLNSMLLYSIRQFYNDKINFYECCRLALSAMFRACIQKVLIISELNTIGSRFTTGLRPRIFGCKSNRRKTSTI